MNKLFKMRKDLNPSPKKRSFLYIIVPTLILGALAIFLFTQPNQAASSKQATTPPVDDATVSKLVNEQAPALIQQKGLTNWKLLDVKYNDTRNEALVWYTEVDPVSGEELSVEPHLILAKFDPKTGNWMMNLSIDDNFGSALQSSYFKDSEIAAQFPVTDPKLPKAVTTLGGYKLPWEAGTTKRLTWSISHSSCAYGYCKYAFDFSDGTMFPVMAAKAGYVFHFRDSCWDGDHGCTNSMTLEDRSTTPYTYQIYLHLKRNSVPEEYRTIGTYVPQGAHIANADNTGYSTGTHLHFMVVSSLTKNPCAWYCWGPSVDITFQDVTVNWDEKTQGGRPRMYSETLSYGGEYMPYNKYTSGNTLSTALQNTPASDAPATKPYKYYLFPIFVP